MGSGRGVRFRIDPARPIDGEIRRIAAGLLDDAAVRIRRGPGAAHAVRAGAVDSLADVRALVRLARGGIDPAARRSATRRIRGARRALAAVSSPSVADAFERAATSAATTLTGEAIADLRAALTEPDSADLRPVPDPSDLAPPSTAGGWPPQSSAMVADAAEAAAWNRLADELDAAVLAASLWHVDGDGFEVLAGGLEREYRRGREALAAVDSTLALDATRAVFGRVADHQRHLRLLRATWPPVVKRYADEAARLAELADRQHGFGLLRVALLDQREREVRRHARAFVGVLDEDREELRRAIDRMAVRLYAEDPAAMVARLAAWWTAAAQR